MPAREGGVMSVIGTIAEAIYEACRQEASDSGRSIVPEPWAERDESFRAQFVATVERICRPGYWTTPEREHESWMQAYLDMGWQYGEVRDPEKKTHPDMVPFSELPESERQKDAIFLACCVVGRAAMTQLAAAEEVIELCKTNLVSIASMTVFDGGTEESYGICYDHAVETAEHTLERIGDYRNTYGKGE